MANYVENIKVGSGETWPVRDADAHEKITALEAAVQKDISDVEGKRVISTYNSLTSFGLSGAVTTERVCSAMPEWSMITLNNSINTSLSVYISDAPVAYGNITIIRVPARASLTCEAVGTNSPTFWQATWHGDSGFSGWVKTGNHLGIDNAWSLNGGTQIAANTDLFTLTTPGNYIAANSVATTLSNCPVSCGFALKVTGGNGWSTTYIRAELRPQGVENGLTYHASAQTSDSGANWTWSGWYEAANQADVDAVKTTANAAMPKAGGTFTGNTKAYETARTTRGIFNEETRATSTSGTLQSVKYFINVT